MTDFLECSGSEPDIALTPQQTANDDYILEVARRTLEEMTP